MGGQEDSRQPKLVSTAELARALGVATRTVNHWVNHRGLEPDAWTLGGHARFDVDRVKAWLREQRKRQTQQRQDEHSEDETLG